MKKNLIFNRILLTVTVSFIFLSCHSDDSLDNGGSPSEGRTKVIMEIPSGVNVDTYNWNNVKLIYSEEFNDTQSYKDNFIFENIFTDRSSSDQLQFYTDKNVEVENGKLKLYARKVGAGQNKGDYSSSRIGGTFAYQYGRIEINAKLPAGEKPGIWSKFGLLGDNIDTVGYPDSGEIDMMEYFSYRPNSTYVVVHSAVNNVENNNLISSRSELETAEEEFHTYGILWTNKYIKFYIDDTENIVYSLNRPTDATEYNWPFDQPFYLLIDMVVGGSIAGAQGVDDSMFPAVMEIDYIRVYHIQ